MNERIDVAVIGGGLSGLTAAALLARQGRQVTVLEGSAHLGGRAQSPAMQGTPVNLGPHALYLGGAAFEVLTSLGLELSTTPPDQTGAQVLRAGQAFPLPTSPWAFLSTPLLTFSERLGLMKIVAPLMAGRIDAGDAETLEAWLTRVTPSRPVRQVLEMLLRLTTYSNAPGLISAGSACRQLGLGLRRNVTYLQFAALVERLAALVGASPKPGRVEPGTSTIRLSTPVRSVSTSGRLELGEGSVLQAEEVVLALPLPAAAKVFHHEPLAAFAARAVPARAACLDLVVSSLPQPGRPFMLGVDEALYASVHQRREGQVVLQLARYLAPGEAGADALAGLEALADLLQPGWRAVLLERRFMPELLVTSAVPTAADEGRGFGSVVLTDHVFAAADWALGGWLCDGGIAAAREVAARISTPLAQVG